MHRRHFTAAVALATLAACSTPLQSTTATPASATEILWDNYGVPHIYADDAQAAYYAFGRAQMENHAELLLLNVASARGRYAEYFGAGKNDENVRSDMDVLTNSIPERAEQWLASGGEEQRALLSAFADGVNDWAESNRDTIDPAIARVLPIKPSDSLALYQLSVHYSFMGARAYTNAKAWQAGQKRAEISNSAFGSNAYAITPKKSATGNAMLIGNPHIDLGAVGPQRDNGFPAARKGLFHWMEAHLVIPGKTNFTGVAFVGSPLQAIGFNDNLGWSHTVNAIQNADVYDLKLEDGDKYRFGNQTLALTKRPASLKVCDFGTDQCEARSFTIASSVHGPVIARRGDSHALALKIAGLDTDRPALQYWRMMTASNITQFESAFSMLQMPYFNVIYADRDGHIMHVDAGQRPVRPWGDYDTYRGILDGSDPRLLWKETVAWNKLPQVRDPVGGFVQNSNDSPWTSTFPAAIKPSQFPAWISFNLMDLRPQQSALALLTKPRLTMDDLVTAKQSTRMILADRWLPDLIPLARKSGDADLLAAAKVLESWDRRADTDSKGAVLFDRFRVAYVATDAPPPPNGNPTTPPEMFRTAFDPARPLETPVGIGQPERAVLALREAVQSMQKDKLPLDIEWGAIHRIALTGRDKSWRNPRELANYPSAGSMDAYGGLRLVKYVPSPADGKMRAAAGEGWIQAIEFQPDGAKAQVLLVYGNASRPGSPHIVDQLPLFAEKALRPAWRDRRSIEANLSRRETVDYSGK